MTFELLLFSKILTVFVMASSSGLDFVSDRQKRRRINFALSARELDGPVGQDYQSSLENVTDNENENLQHLPTKITVCMKMRMFIIIVQKS